MAKGIYVGGSALQITTIPITDWSIRNQYFICGSYSGYYSWDFDTSRLGMVSGNKGIDNSSARFSMIARQDIHKITFNYSYSSETGFDKFTLQVAGVVIEDGVSGNTTVKSYSGPLAKGQEIYFQYDKDSSSSRYDDECVIYNIVIELTDGTILDNVAREVKQPYVGIEGVARKVTKGFIGVDNVARQCFSYRTLSELSVGDTVKMNFKFGTGTPTPTEFLIVHKGNPNVNIYDSSCDGIWLLIKDCYIVQNYSGAEQSNEFAGVNHYFLNNTILPCLDEDIQSIIKEIKIPYYVSGMDYTLNTLENGFPVKLFYLSYPEVDSNGYWQYGDGSILDHFTVATNRKAYYEGTAVGWWLRTPREDHKLQVGYVDANCSMVMGANAYLDKLGNRFALVLPHETLVDPNFNVIA